MAFVAVTTLANAQTNYTVRRLLPGAGALRAVASNGTVMIAVGDGGRILSSTDGATWTARQSGVTARLNGATHGDGKFVVVGDGGCVLKSWDGFAWERASRSNTGYNLRGVTYGNGRFVAAGDDGVVFTSVLDADEWTEIPQFVTTALYAADYVAGSFFLAGQAGTIWTSTNGIGWANRYQDGNHEVASIAGNVAVGDANFVAFGNYQSWGVQPQVPGLPVKLRGITQAAGVSLAVGENGMIASLYSSTSGWTVYDSGTAKTLNAVTFFADTFVVVGEEETILQSAPVFCRRLVNLSTRAQVGGGDQTLITGLVVTGLAPKRFLLRGIGPSLSAYNVDAPMAKPALTLFNGAGVVVRSAEDWSSSPEAQLIQDASRQAGAFALPAGSQDSAMVVTLPPGVYTAVVAPRDRVGGVALVECYDLEPGANPSSHLVNLSARAFVGTGQNVVIGGLVVDQRTASRYLIRAVGPGLAQFGIRGFLANPMLRVIRPASMTLLIGGPVTTPATTIGENDNWNDPMPSNPTGYFSSRDKREITQKLGAFPLAENSADSVVVVTPSSLATVEVSGVNGSSGVVLIEVYDITDL